MVSCLICCGWFVAEEFETLMPHGERGMEFFSIFSGFMLLMHNESPLDKNWYAPASQLGSLGVVGM